MGTQDQIQEGSMALIHERESYLWITGEDHSSRSTRGYHHSSSQKVRSAPAHGRRSQLQVHWRGSQLQPTWGQLILYGIKCFEIKKGWVHCLRKWFCIDHGFTQKWRNFSSVLILLFVDWTLVQVYQMGFLEPPLIRGWRLTTVTRHIKGCLIVPWDLVALEGQGEKPYPLKSLWSH